MDDAQVCIVGGGPAGMSMARSLLRHGISFELFERHDDVGGLWDPANEGTPVYDSAHFISSKTQSHYADFDMPDDYPDYPSNQQILAYMKAFADEFGLREHMTFGVSVEQAERTGTGWSVRLSTGETRTYADLVCANGTNWFESMPDYPGEFTGEIRHSRTYSSLDEFVGRRVLVIGAGNSGCDIACDAAKVADAAYISMRRGYHFIPKHLFGIPSDQFAASGPHLPMWLEQRVFAGMLRVINGNPRRLGLPKPDHKLFESHPIMNTQLLHYLSHGDIAAKPDVARFDGSTVRFVDGTSAEVDLVICATGYRWRIPYVDESAFHWSGGRPDLYLNLISRSDPHLFALGFMETNGGAYKLFDEMADLIARTIMARSRGAAASAGIDRLVATDHPDLSNGVHYVGSPRHATYVDSYAYRKHLAAVLAQLGWPGLEPGCFDRLRRPQVGAA
jgi:hypothetical protein